MCVLPLLPPNERAEHGLPERKDRPPRLNRQVQDQTLGLHRQQHPRLRLLKRDRYDVSRRGSVHQTNANANDGSSTHVKVYL